MKSLDAPDTLMPAVLRIAVVLLAQWRMIVACTILAVLASVVYLTTRTPAYEINAELYIQIGQEMAPPPTVFASDRQQASPQLKRPEDVHSEVEFLRSPLLTRAVVEHFGDAFFLKSSPRTTLWQRLKGLASDGAAAVRWLLERPLIVLGLRPELSDRDKIILLLSKSLEVEAVARSDLISIKLLYPDPERGRQILDHHIATYIERRNELFHGRTLNGYLETLTAPAEAELVETEKRLVAAKQQRQAWDLERQRTHKIDQLDRLEQRRLAIGAELARTRAEMSQTTEALMRLPGTSAVDSRGMSNLSGGSKPTPVERAGIIFEGQGEVFRLLQADALRKNAVISGLEAEAVFVEAQVIATSQLLREIELDRIELAQLERKIEQMRRRTKLVIEGLDLALVSESLRRANISNIRLAVPPNASILPSSPRIYFTLGAGLALGLAAVIGLVVTADALRPLVRSDEDIRSALGAMTVAQVSDVRR